MKRYRLPIVVHPPTDGSEGRYFAEIPGLPGCCGWGNTPAEAMFDVENVFHALAPTLVANDQSLLNLAPMKFKPSNGAVIRGEVTLQV